MSDIEAYGLSSSQSAGLGQGNTSIAANGISEVSLVGLGEGIISMAASGLSELQSTAFGESSVAPGIASVLTVLSTKIRITFDSQMTNDAALVDLDNYSIVPVGIGVSIYKVSIEAEEITFPNYVDITISEMTDNQVYEIDIETGVGGPIDRFGDRMDPAKSSKTFFGLGTFPEIKYVESIGETSVKVVFTEAMEDNVKIRDASNYSFDNSLSVSEVTDVSVDSVFLETSEQVPGLLYTLTITS